MGLTQVRGERVLVPPLLIAMKLSESVISV